MAVFDNFPYSNNHELNLDWIIAQIKRILTMLDELDARVTALEEGDNNGGI